MVQKYWLIAKLFYSWYISQSVVCRVILKLKNCRKKYHVNFKEKIKNKKKPKIKIKVLKWKC